MKLSTRFTGWVAGFVVATQALAAAPEVGSPRSTLRYDFDYPGLNYASAPADNPITRLQHRMESGLHLKAKGPTGHLESLLHELGIDPSSQVLIYSKTSLQTELIEPTTPRAVYFNDDTYIGFVHGSDFIEITTLDPKLGLMFYGLVGETPKQPARFSRETGRCLSCHDTYSMLGGGTPRVLVTSAPVIRPDAAPPAETSSMSTDRTPISERWGGWYVTGDLNGQAHLGNLPLDDSRRASSPLKQTPRQLRTLAKAFDTTTYLRDTSDVVALFVLEHQTHVQNMMVRASYKARTALKRVTGSDEVPRTWAALPPALQKSFVPLAEPLSQAILMEGVTPLAAPVVGSSGFDAWFQKQGPRDARGRSLRELDLRTEVFRYPLSYQLYGEAFDALPPYLKDYVYSRIERSAQDTSGSPEVQARRRDAVEILLATKPEFAARQRQGS